MHVLVSCGPVHGVVGGRSILVCVHTAVVYDKIIMI